MEWQLIKRIKRACGAQCPPKSLALMVAAVTGLGEWTHAGVQENVADTRAIDRSIDRGVEHLRGLQSLEGRWAWQHPGRKSRAGATALALYALIESDVPRGDSAVRRGLAALGEMSVRETYDAASVLLFLLAHDRVEHRPWILRLVKQLIDEQKDGAWGYPGGEDMSNTQYAATALWMASLAGVDVPNKVWVALAETLPRYASQRGGFVYRTDTRAKPAPGMTAAGLACLEICQRALGDELEGVQRPKELVKSLERYGKRGREWLGGRYKAERFKRMQTDGLGYFFYSVERLGAFSGERELGGRSWYEVGAQFLLGEQRENGGWGHLYAGSTGTTFALLFLNRATSKAAVSGPASMQPQEGANAKIKPEEERRTKWLIELARDFGSNIVPIQSTRLTASSSSKGHPADAVADGARGTYWLCKEKDRSPSITLQFQHEVEANSIVLGHVFTPTEPADRKSLHESRAVAAVIIVNGGPPQRVVLPREPLDRFRLVLPEPLKLKEVTINLIRSEDLQRCPVGLSEIEVHLRSD